MSTRLTRLGDRLYEWLVVAAPGDVGSRVLNGWLVLLIAVNVIAQGVELWGPADPRIVEGLVWLHRVSIGLFAVEYLARLRVGHVDGSRPATSYLRRVLHPLMLVDLAVLMAWAGSGWWAVDLRHLRLLRIPDLLARISRTFAGAELDEDETPFAEVLTDRQRALAALRTRLASVAQQDLSDLHTRLHETTTKVRRVQQRWLLTARRDLTQAQADAAGTRGTIEEILADLEGHLASAERLDAGRDAVRNAWEATAGIWDDITDRVVDVRDLQWRGRLAYRDVPARRIGQRHFAGLDERWEAAYDSFARVYGDGLRDGFESVRSAMGYPFDMVERGDIDARSTSQLQSALTRAVDRGRDLDEPSRAAWEQMQWELELAHVRGIELVQEDVGRYGRVDFYLGRLLRNVTTGLVEAIEWVRHGAVQLGPRLRARIERDWQQARDAVRPLLEFLGLARPPAAARMEQAEQARLESVLQRGLPEDYLTHFDMHPLEDEGLLVGFERELADVDRAVERWEAEQTSSFIIHGPRGGGKTSMLNVAERRLFEEDALVTRDVIDDKITRPDELTEYLARLLGLPAEGGIEAQAAALLAGPRRAVILEGCHNLYLRRIGGLEAIRQLLWLVARTNHHVLWGLCLDENARAYLAHWLPFERLFHFDINIGEHTGPELRRLIMQRHNLSGYRLRYADGPRVRRALRRRLGRYERVEEPAVQEALAGIYFEELASTCVDNTTVAQFYWLRSLETVGSDAYRVQPHEPVDLDQVRDLSLDAAFVLAAILQHDNLTPTELAGVLDRTLIDVRLELEILWNSNILGGDLAEERFRINAVALKPVQMMLRGRNLIPEA